MTFQETGDLYLSYAVTDNGVVVGNTPYAINTRLAPGGRRIESPQDSADYIASWGAKAGQTVHVWIGGGVEVPNGATLDGLRPADASATK